jgi:hypothetical protein
MTNCDDTKRAEEHTPEPWWIDDDGFIAAGAADSYCTVADPHCRPTAGYGDENEANARRIVAAVNACQGLATEALEHGVVAELRQVLAEFLDAAIDGVTSEFDDERLRLNSAIRLGSTALARATAA